MNFLPELFFQLLVEVRDRLSIEGTSRSTGPEKLHFKIEFKIGNWKTFVGIIFVNGMFKGIASTQ